MSLIIKSYKLDLHFTNNGRQITKAKLDTLSHIHTLFKQFTNYISKENYSGKNFTKGQSFEKTNEIRKSYEQYFQQTLTAGYAQNVYKFANDKYNTTIKTFFSCKKSGTLKTKKTFPNKPYFERIEFPLDYRMLKTSTVSGEQRAFIKDEKVKNLYWLSILNPFQKDKTTYKRNINLPLYVYPEVQQLIDSGAKYSFSLCDGYIKINFKFEVNTQQLEQSIKDSNRLEKIALDFGKYLSTTDSEGQTDQYDLSNFYKKCKKIQYQVSQLRSRLDILKNSHNYGTEFKELNVEISRLYKRVTAIRKSTYGFIANKLTSQYKTIIVEDLSIGTIEKSSKHYKGRRFNKLMTVMGTSIWKGILDYKVNLVGNQKVLVDCRYTSQTCNSCGHIDRKNRSGRLFHCTQCEYEEDADIHASRNIYTRGVLCLA